MTQRTINILIDEIYSKPPRRNYITNETNVHHVDETWSSDRIDLRDYGPENKRNFIYVSVIFDNCSKFGWTVPLKKDQTITNSLENILNSSKRRSNLIESDDGTEFVNKTFTNLSNYNHYKRYSRNPTLGAVFAERFNRSIRILLKKPVFERSDANWINVLPTITKQYSNRIHSSTKLTQIEASLKKKEGYVYHNLSDKRKKIKAKFQ